MFELFFTTMGIVCDGSMTRLLRSLLPVVSLPITAFCTIHSHSTYHSRH